MKQRCKSGQRKTGSMLLLSIMVLGIVSLVIIVGIVLNSMLFVQKRLQSQTDSLSLTVAQGLNSGDRAGQMNNMIANCRELVFTSRRTQQGIAKHYPHLEPLARHLAEQSRASAQLLEGERRRLITLTMIEARNTIQTGSYLSSTSEITIPWLKTSDPKVTQASLGYVAEVESNVSAPFGNKELLDLDESSGYLQKESNLYFGNIDAKLPAPDNDLIFKLSSLPAPVKGTIAPIRLLSPDGFRATGKINQDGKAANQICDQIPSAGYLIVSMKMASNAKDPKGSDLATSAAATAVGAAPLP